MKNLASFFLSLAFVSAAFAGQEAPAVAETSKKAKHATEIVAEQEVKETEGNLVADATETCHQADQKECKSCTKSKG